MLRNTTLELGIQLKKRRELLGLVQPQLSEIAGISTRTIQLIEAGKANPSIHTLLQITEALGLSMALSIKNITPNKNA